MPSDPKEVALLLSGGLDSTILLHRLLVQGNRVHPLYISGNLAWESAEQKAVRRIVRALGQPGLMPLVRLALPLDDLYEEHWAVNGRGVPDASTPDDAVYLPGRNVMLIVKAALWCQLHGVGRLALAPLSSNPFSDARGEFFRLFSRTLNLATQGTLSIERPFRRATKAQVMKWGSSLPLELTFSCIRPVAGRHCGSCNKCAERRLAFAEAGRTDLTQYADSRAHRGSNGRVRQGTTRVGKT
jgi:7-cyano-7-deazaguanine synthase